MMGRREWLKIFATAAMGTVVSACIVPLDVLVGDDDDPTVQGSGHVVTESREVTGFDAVVVTGVGRVVIVETGREALTVTGEDNILPHLTTRVDGDRLVIGPDAGASLSPTRELVFLVEVDRLSRIEGSGAVVFEVALEPREALRVDLSGVSTMVADGEVRSLNLNTSGVTTFWGGKLRTRSARVSASGVSQVLVWTTERLDVVASGVSSVRYMGGPDVHATVSGLSSVGPC